MKDEAGERLQRLLGGDALAALRARLRRRYERGQTSDAFVLQSLSTDERRALEGLLGRPLRQAASMRLAIDELDRALARAGLATSLRAALERLDGPIRELAAERAEREAAWQAVFTECSHARLRQLVARSAARGLVKRLAAGDAARGLELLRAAQAVLARLPQPGVPLARLAAEVLGDAHALDAGRPVGTLVLAALREADAGERPRERWARRGVLVNELVAPVLVLNLPAQADTPGGALAALAAARGEPLHLSLRLLLRAPPRWGVAERCVFVCENPSVVSLAADHVGARCAPLVCTDGMPAAAQRTLLAQLAAAGARLAYHGDFDWPGIAIGNFVLRSFGARPWRFGAADYVAPRGRRLAGAPVVARWDAALSEKLSASGFALEEEAVVESLLADLAAG